MGLRLFEFFAAMGDGKEASLEALLDDQSSCSNMFEALSPLTSDIMTSLVEDAEEFLKEQLPELRKKKSTQGTEVLRLFGLQLSEYYQSSTGKGLRWQSSLGHAMATTCEVMINDPDEVITYEIARKVLKPLLANECS